MQLIRSILFFGAWGGWWGCYLGGLCGTLIVPLFGTVLAAQVGVFMGVVIGLAWGAVLGLAIGPMSELPPLKRTQVRRAWATIAVLVGGTGAVVAVLIASFGWFPPC